jgi:transposase
MDDISCRRRKRRGHPEAQLEDLPMEAIEYRLLPEEQLCSCCDEDLLEMSTEVRPEIKSFRYRYVWSNMYVTSTLAAAVSERISKCSL